MWQTCSEHVITGYKEFTARDWHNYNLVFYTCDVMLLEHTYTCLEPAPDKTGHRESVLALTQAPWMKVGPAWVRAKSSSHCREMAEEREHRLIE